MYMSIRGASSGFGRSLCKHSKCSISFYPKTGESTLKAIAPANMSCCLATSGTNTTGSVPFGGRISSSTGTCSPNWCAVQLLFPLKFYNEFTSECLSLSVRNAPYKNLCIIIIWISLLSLACSRLLDSRDKAKKRTATQRESGRDSAGGPCPASLPDSLHAAVSFFASSLLSESLEQATLSYIFITK